MTKFEEELNKIEVEVQTPLDKYIVEKATSDESLYAQHYEAVLEKFKDWHSDEDYQRAKRMVEHVQVENEMLKAKLKSQQQALPVVPDYIGKLINTFGPPKDGEYINYEASYPENKKELDWIDKHQKTWLTALLVGYTVEKPQLFYLKHIDFCKTDKHYDWFTIKHSDGPLNHLRVEKGEKPSTIDCKFTQQEIDSMKTGSYEKIEVAE